MFLSDALQIISRRDTSALQSMNTPFNNRCVHYTPDSRRQSTSFAVTCSHHQLSLLRAATLGGVSQVCHREQEHGLFGRSFLVLVFAPLLNCPDKITEREGLVSAWGRHREMVTISSLLPEALKAELPPHLKATLHIY